MNNFDADNQLTVKGLQYGDNNTQNNIFNKLITISVDVIKTRTFNPNSPYKSLRKFEATPIDSQHFFGREQLISGLMKELDNSNLLLLLGASGSGKSSVIQAGLIPHIERKSSNFTYFILRPDKNPFQSLFNVFSGKYGQDKAEIIQKENENIFVELVKTLKAKDDSWLIYIDQFEEIFHLSDQTQSKKFINALVKLYDHLNSSSDLSVKLVMTMRTDFLDKFSAYSKFKNITITQKNMDMIANMNPDELRQAIEQPAAQNGVIFEDGLVKRIIDEVKDQPGYLPLLQYTLDLLWSNDKNLAEDKTLNISSYNELGGVRGALQQHVNKIYESLAKTKGSQEDAKKIFLKLVTVETNQESGTLQKAVSKPAKMSDFQGESILSTVKILVDNNLLVTNKSEVKTDTATTVEIAHEILLDSWETLKNWIKESYQVIELKNDLVKGLERWKVSKKQEDFLAGSLLAEVKAKRDTKTFSLVLGELTEEEHKFIDGSYNYAEQQRNKEIRTARRIAAGSVGALIISSGLGLMAWQKTQQAELNLADARGFSSLTLFDKGKELDAFVEAIKAGKTLQNQHAYDKEVTNALQELLNRKSEHNRLEGHDDSVRSISFSPNGKTLASGSGDKTIKLWNLETGKEICTLKGHDKFVWSVSFSPNGKTLASGSGDNTIKLWNKETGWGLDALMGRSCDWVRVYLHNPNSGVREEDRHLCDGIGTKNYRTKEILP